MARRIKIKWAASYAALPSAAPLVRKTDGFRIRIWVECASEMPSTIFVYRQMPLNPVTQVRAGFFSHIASPVDLEEMPEQEPRAGEIPEWFRLDYVDVLLRSTTEIEAFLQDVLQDVCRLKESLDRLDTITPTGEDTCGPAFDCDGSSVSSESSLSSVSEVSVSIGEHARTCTGTMELGVGYGQPWLSVGLGAGSPVGSSDSIGSDSRNASQVTLLSGLVSQQLIIRGFPCFNDVPDDAIITGVEARLTARWAIPDASGSSSASSEASEPSEPFQGPQLVYFRLYHPQSGPIGEEKSASNPIYGPAWQTLGFGAPSDDWDAVLTGKDVKQGNFGVMLIVFLPATGPSEQIDCGSATEGAQGVNTEVVEVDGVELTLYWSS